MPGTYQYEPGNIAEYGKDRMRFELGDVMVEGKEKTCALCDEEYNAVIPEKVPTARQWKKAKLRCLESIMRKFAYGIYDLVLDGDAYGRASGSESERCRS